MGIISITPEIALKSVPAIIAITSTYVREITLNIFFLCLRRFPRKCPRFEAIVRAGTRVEFGIRRANYTFGYFVVLPACGLRNDRLFINDLSLGTSWAITLVPRKSRAQISQSELRYVLFSYCLQRGLDI